MESIFKVTTKHALEKFTGTFYVSVCKDGFYGTYYAFNNMFGCGRQYKTEKAAVSGLINANGTYIKTIKKIQ